MQKKYILGLAATVILALSACSKKEAPRTPETIPAPSPTVSAPPTAGVAVAAVTLGSAIGADKKISQASDTFGAKDTIYASVDTIGTGTAMLKAKWTYRKNGQETEVMEDAQTIAPTGPARSEFHISKPDGWPSGDYRVDIFVGDKAAQTKTFTVK